MGAVDEVNLAGSIDDDSRIDYLRQHIEQMAKAVWAYPDFVDT